MKIALQGHTDASGAQGWDTEAPGCCRGHALSALSLEGCSAKANSIATFGKEFPKRPLLAAVIVQGSDKTCHGRRKPAE